MTIRDSKGKFTKAAPFKVGDRVIVLSNYRYNGLIGSTGTVLNPPFAIGVLVSVAFLPDYPYGLKCPQFFHSGMNISTFLIRL